jgi:glycerol-3-phosphate dehydrogenase
MEDVIIIGGGICGCSLLYELSRYNVNALLLEKENDVADATTKANSAIVHAGYDPEPGTLMARVNVEGCALIEQLAKDLDIMYKKIGSLVVGFDDTDRAAIEKLLDKGNKNGVPGLRIVEGEELFKMEPNLSRGITCALYAPSAGIVAPWELALAQAECAVKGGAKVELETEVTGITKGSDGNFTVKTNKGEFKSRFVVNCAGTHSDVVSQMVEPSFFKITPKKGEYYVLDTTEGKLVNMTVFPCPSALGKGVLVSPTVHGNIIIGPDSTPWAIDDYSTTAAGLDYIKKNADRIVPGINYRAAIRNYSGLRADAGIDDFIVAESKTCKGFFNNGAIKSPGLTSAPAIAKETAKLLKNAGLSSEPNPNFVAKRKVVRFKELSQAEKKELLAKNPAYGTIICRCMTITEGEILDAFKRPIPPRSVDAVKRRVSAGMGRCQGGFCGPRVFDLIKKNMNIPAEKIMKDKEGMYVVNGRTKKEQVGGAK